MMQYPSLSQSLYQLLEKRMEWLTFKMWQILWQIIYLNNDKLNLATVQPTHKTKKILQYLCSIFDHSNSRTTVCLLASWAACRWDLEMTPCLNFTEVAPYALSVSEWYSLRFQTTYSFSLLRNVSQALFVFCLPRSVGLCCGPLTPPIGHKGRGWRKKTLFLMIHGLHFSTKLNFINKEATLIWFLIYFSWC